jgi:hypothetical protein
MESRPATMLEATTPARRECPDTATGPVYNASFLTPRKVEPTFFDFFSNAWSGT